MTATTTPEIVFTESPKGFRLHKAGCRYAKTGQRIVDLTMFGQATPATCCRPKPEHIEAAASALNAEIFPKLEAPVDAPAEETPAVEDTPAPAAKRRKLADPAAEAPAKPKAKKARAKKAAAPKTPKETKVIASKKLLDSDQVVPSGTRWIRRNRLGALVASVDLFAQNGDDGGMRWGAVCVTHVTTVRHETHRAAWATLAKSDAWCSGCKAEAAAK